MFEICNSFLYFICSDFCVQKVTSFYCYVVILIIQLIGSCADNVAILTTTPCGLQHQLESLKVCCDRLKMEVTTDKLKFMVFRKGDYLSKHEEWFYDGAEMEAVNKYSYLGFVFTATLGCKTRYRSSNSIPSVFFFLSLSHFLPLSPSLPPPPSLSLSLSLSLSVLSLFPSLSSSPCFSPSLPPSLSVPVCGPPLSSLSLSCVKLAFIFYGYGRVLVMSNPFCVFSNEDF